jgi:microcystin-dependent protein
MQAGSGKMLFGPQADVNIYRDGANILKTDDNFVVKQALRVEGDNHHLTIMLIANETVSRGDVISICEGYACVGYGFATMPPSSLSTAINGLKAIRLDNARLLVLYRDRAAGAASRGQSKAGSMTSGTNGIKTMTKSTTPEKTFTTTAISSFDAAPFLSNTNTSKTSMFVVCYQAAGKQTGKCRIGQVTNLGTNELTYYPEKEIYSGAGNNYVDGLVDTLGISKFLISSVNSENAIRLQVCQFNRQSANFEISDCGTMEQDRENKGTTDTDASYLAMTSLTESTAMLAYRYQKSGDVGRLAIVGITAKSPKIIADFTFNQQSCRHFEVVRMTDTSAVVAYREPKQGFLAYGVIATHVVTAAGNHQIKTSTPVPIAPRSAIDNTYKLTLTRISESKLMLGYRDTKGRLTLVDIDVVGTTLVVGSPQLVANIGASSFYDTLYLDKGNFGIAYQNDNDPTLKNTGYVVFGETYGGSLRTGVATSSGPIGSEVQVAVTGIIKVPPNIIMTPGARYYGMYKGGLSSSSNDGVLLGRAMSSTHLLLERDFAGGFHSKELDGQSSAYTGEIRTLAGATIPNGWLQCDGQALNRITYSNLFNVIGTTWGTGDGTTTFNIPDLRGRTTLGSGKGVSTITPGVDSKKWKNPKPTNHVLGEYDGQESYATPTKKACSGAYQCSSTGGYWNGIAYTASSDSFNMGPYATVIYMIKT